MSNKNKKKSSRRPYKLKARARRRNEVHRRITLAAMHLHETVGPARTTMEAIAKDAGVQRATVYNHFPTDLDLIDACSSHWILENPPPDATPWAEIADPKRRTESALDDMYNYFDQGKDMLEKVLRDAPLVPALAEINSRKLQPMLEHVVELLATGWENAGSPTDHTQDDVSAPIRAILRVALDFFTWQTLTRSGLSNNEAARLVAAWIDTVANEAE